jgi:hypothetical protein
MLTTKNAQKGPKYAKFAEIGYMVYSKGLDVHCEAPMRHWYGDLWKEKWLYRTIWMNLTFSVQPEERPDNMSLVTY